MSALNLNAIDQSHFWRSAAYEVWARLGLGLDGCAIEADAATRPEIAGDEFGDLA